MFPLYAIENAALSAEATAAYTVPMRAARPLALVISGTVFEDVNYGGGAGRSYAVADASAVASGFAAGSIRRPGALVELYSALGTYVSSTLTNATGQYTFNAPLAGNYIVRVVNSTVSSVRPGYAGDLLPVQTFVVRGGVADANRVGGEAPEKVDAVAAPPETVLRFQATGTGFEAAIDLVEIRSGTNILPGVVANPSFELPNVGTNSGFAFATAPTGAGWVFGSTAGVIGNGQDARPNAPDGTQIAYLQGATTGTLEQSLSLPPGNYTVRFRASSFNGNKVVQVLANGVSIFNQTITTNLYTTYTTGTFTVASPVVTLAGLNTATTVAQSQATVTAGATDVTNVDFGFNFNTITNTRFDGQGSLAQFVANSNALTNANLAQQGKPAGKETSLFMIPNGAATSAPAGLRAGLVNQLSAAGVAVIDRTSGPGGFVVRDANTVLDGTTQTLNIGNTNALMLGAGGTVGVGDSTLARVNRPEVELLGPRPFFLSGFFDPVTFAGVAVSANNTTIKGLSISGFFDCIFLNGDVSGTLIEQNMVGTRATSFTDPPVRTVRSGIYSGGGDNGIYRNNLIGFMGQTGVWMVGSSNNNIVRQNEIRTCSQEIGNLDGLEPRDASTNNLIQANLVTENQGEGIDTFESVGGNRFIQNSLTRNGRNIAVNGTEGEGIRIHGIANQVIGNVITDNDSQGLLVTIDSRNNTISRNSFARNTGLAIDLIDNVGVTLNDINDSDATGGNTLVNFPILTSLSLTAGNLVVTGFARPGAVVEFYIPAADPSGFGEGQTFVATRTEGSGDDANGGTGTYGPGLINGLSQGQDATNRFAFTLPFSSLTSALQAAILENGLTSTATLAGIGTSEFSGNIIFTADVAAFITPQAASVTAGQSGQFNVVFSNIGASLASGVNATVQLPAGLTNVVASGGSYSPSTGLVTYAGLTLLNPEQSFTSTITYTQPATSGAVVAVAAIQTTTNQLNNTRNDSQSATIQTGPSFDLATTLSGPLTAGAGQLITFGVTSANNGPTAAPNAVQTVTLPTPAALSDVFLTNGGSYSFSGGVSTFTFPLPAQLGVGRVVNNTFSFAAPAAGSGFNMLATITPNTAAGGETTVSNNTASLSGTTTGPAIAVANVYTTISSNAPRGGVAPGTAVTYTIVEGNQGIAAATDVITRVALQPGLTTTGFTVNGTSGTLVGGNIVFTITGGSASYNPTTGLLTLPTLATQASAASQTFTVVAPAPATGGITATASVSATTTDPVAANNVAVTQVTVTNPFNADLATRLVGPSTATAGQRITYTATTTNNGPTSAQNAVQTLDLPAGLPLTGTAAIQLNSNGPLSISGTVATYENGATYDASTGLATFALSVSGPGSSATNSATFTAAPGNTSALTVVTSVAAKSIDVVMANNTARQTTTVASQADVELILSGPEDAVIGNQITYVATVTNNGPSLVTNQTTSLQLPANLGVGSVTATGPTGAGTYNNTTGVVTFPSQTNVTPGPTGGAVYRVTLVAPNVNEVTISGVVTATDSNDSNPANNKASANTGLNQPTTPVQTNLGVSVTSNVGSQTAGQPITLTIGTSNAGPNPATGVVQQVALVPGLNLTTLRYNNATGTVSGTKVSFGMVTYDAVTGLLTLPLGNLANAFTASNTLTLDAPSNGPLVATTFISGNETDATTANNQASTSVSIVPSANVATTISGPTQAAPGTTATYSIVTANNGPSNAANVVQTVTLPAGATNVVSSGGSLSGNVVTFPAIANQLSGTMVTNTVSFTVPATTPSIAVLGNVTSGTADPVAANNSTTFTTQTTQANQPPVAYDVVNNLQNPRGSSAIQALPLAPLAGGDPDTGGSLATFTILSLPPAIQGTLFVNNTPVTTLAPGGLSVTATSNGFANLSFVPANNFVGNVFFTYSAVDNGNGTPANALTSNVARYTIQVGQDNGSIYAQTPTKGGATVYQNNDVLAYVVDPNGAAYSTSGQLYNASTGQLVNGGTGVSNGLATTGTNATTNAAGTTLLTDLGVTLNPSTGQITVTDRTKLKAGTYQVTVTTSDLFGGVTTQIVPFTIGTAPLPVELVFFKAKAAGNEDALLSWRTAQELNNDRFEVERSFDGQAFVSIGRVAGQGSKATPTDYALTDVGVGLTVGAAPVYYRLRQVDRDGTATYSAIQVVSFTAQPIRVSVYPSPATLTTKLDLTTLPTGVYHVLLIDMTGRTLGTYDLSGGQSHALDVVSLPSGVYTVQVQGVNGRALTARLVKE
ncbi:T9SS type A sorting domain-containing protein [Hymenobacter terrenus]|uniref:T9SS type A sorting domain-containing protein n=1 Tax=Hymenobacter terrenus TaxID=1629124 RepID=UPI00061952AF|nr:T9SS type A sorting domain-containing protein [Hymenobacter terrenus]